MNKPNNRIIIFSVAVIVAITYACSLTNLPTLGQPTPVSNIPLQNILLQDDFSSDTGEWEIFSDDVEGSTNIVNGVYAIKSLDNLWLWGRTDTSFTDTVTQFDATFISGPANDNAGVGLYCRLNLRDDTTLDAYMLAISADGYYAILEFVSGSPTSLVEWAFSSAINTGYNSTNNIRATCNGNQLILEVNGQQLASANIPAGGATSGYLSLAAISFESAEPAAEVNVDNLLVTKP